MLEKAADGVDTVRKIVYIVLAIAVVVILGFYGYKYFFSSNVINSNNIYFELTVPGKYTLIENTVADDDYELAKYDSNKQIYLFGLVYGNTNDFVEGVRKDYDYYVESGEYNNVTELEEIEINGLKALRLTYDYKYTDNNNSKNYYTVMTFIDGEFGEYIIYAESLLADKDKYKDDLIKISNTFKELE